MEKELLDAKERITKLEAELASCRALSNARYMEACNQAQLAEDLAYELRNDSRLREDDLDRYADLVVCKYHAMDRGQSNYAARKAEMKAALRFASDYSTGEDRIRALEAELAKRSEPPSDAAAVELARQVEIRAHELMLANNPELRRQLHEHEAQARRDMESRMWKAVERALLGTEEPTRT